MDWIFIIFIHVRWFFIFNYFLYWHDVILFKRIFFLFFFADSNGNYICRVRSLTVSDSAESDIGNFNRDWIWIVYTCWIGFMLSSPYTWDLFLKKSNFFFAFLFFLKPKREKMRKFWLSRNRSGLSSGQTRFLWTRVYQTWWPFLFAEFIYLPFKLNSMIHEIFILFFYLLCRPKIKNSFFCLASLSFPHKFLNEVNLYHW